MKKAEVPIPRTAIVPAAGLGTRFLPATKTVPKELRAGVARELAQ